MLSANTKPKRIRNSAIDKGHVEPISDPKPGG